MPFLILVRPLSSLPGLSSRMERGGALFRRKPESRQIELRNCLWFPCNQHGPLPVLGIRAPVEIPVYLDCLQSGLFRHPG